MDLIHQQLRDLPPQAKVLLASASAFVATTSLLLFVLNRPEPTLRSITEDPVGSQNTLKNVLAHAMAWISRKKELRKSSSSSPQALEAFHKPENHPFFNESYYFNGCDLKTRDRFITRISRRSYLGSRSYVFLLIDSKEHGMLQLEEDCPSETEHANPTAMGLRYTCVVPMKQWRLQYKGPLRKGLYHPKDYVGKSQAQSVLVDLDLMFEVDSPLFWYMRDDHPSCLANNLSQERWGWDFLKVCLKRTIDHAHYEDFGLVRGTISVANHPSPAYEFATFRDHSWDIRRWATMDRLKILLVAFETPLRLLGVDYWYLDLTLVDMPGNASGVARYSTGYLLGKQGTPMLVMLSGSSVLNVQSELDSVPVPGARLAERRPTAEEEVLMRLTRHPSSKGNSKEEVCLTVKMHGPIRRLLYWPDQGAHKVFEDSQEFTITDCGSGASVSGYGTRQTGFRVGEFDPTLGGCG